MNPFRLLKRLIDWPLDAIARWSKSFNPYVPDDLAHDGIEPVRIEEDGIKKQSGKLIFVAFAVFLVWAFTAPLDAGVVVNGSVVVMGSRKAVQHPNGGVVEQILVREGDQVKQGDTVLRINPLNLEANLRQAEYEFINALAAHSRLVAERTGQASIQWDADLAKFNANPQVLEAKRLQLSLFISRRKEIADQRAIFVQQHQGLVKQLDEKNKIMVLRLSQLGPIEQDAQSVRQLAQGGYVPRARANEAERGSIEAQAGIAALQSDLAATRTAIGGVQLEMNKVLSTFNKDVDTELSEVQRHKETLRANVDSLRFDKSLAELKAPVSGTVVGLKTHTEGGVITGGQVLMEIVPLDQRLIAEAAVPPHLIDKVSVGLVTDMRFSAFNSITTPVVPGVVRLVGADRLPPSPPQFPEEYFLIQVETTEEGRQLLSDKNIVAGMPVEVVIKSGERSFMSYLLKPLTDRFARSFKD